MRLVLDENRCQGHGRCYSLFPDLFGSDFEGRGVVRAAVAEAADIDVAQRAIEACPERALELATNELETNRD
jgi:ferredoxin